MHVGLCVCACMCACVRVCVCVCGCDSSGCNFVAEVSKDEDKNIATFDMCSVAEYYCRVDSNEETKCESLYD